MPILLHSSAFLVNSLIIYFPKKWHSQLSPYILVFHAKKWQDFSLYQLVESWFGYDVVSLCGVLCTRWLDFSPKKA